MFRKAKAIGFGTAFFFCIVIVATVTMIVAEEPSGVTKANFDCIKIGMTRAEVEDVFGCQSTIGVVWASGSPGQHSWEYYDAQDGAKAFIEFRDLVVTRADWTPAPETLIECFVRLLCRCFKR